MITAQNIPYKYHSWLNQSKSILIGYWGLNSALADRIAILLLYATYFGVNFTITSGFRDPAYQAELRKRWDEGNRSGLRYRPALKSRHSYMTSSGKPDAQGIDIAGTDENENILGSWAPFFGLKWGGVFTTPDKVHFYIDDL